MSDQKATGETKRREVAMELVASFCAAPEGSPIFNLSETPAVWSAAVNVLRKYLTAPPKENE